MQGTSIKVSQEVLQEIITPISCTKHKEQRRVSEAGVRGRQQLTNGKSTKVETVAATEKSGHPEYIYSPGGKKPLGAPPGELSDLQNW